MTDDERAGRTGVTYRLLGRSGLRVSPLGLGTMTFGNDRGWGADVHTARAIYTAYVAADGNFLDTADGYAGGRSEEWLGRFMAEMGNRDAMVVATKFTLNGRAGDPNAGGNGRKNIHRALEGSLRRLGTDYIDLYWLHTWDGLTPLEEVLETLDCLVKSGKVRYVGLSNVPAWYLARYQTLAEGRGLARVNAVQLEYSLVERSIEREHLPAAQELGVGLCCWSPLGSGFLSGKYSRDDGSGRLSVMSGSRIPMFAKRTERNFGILDVLREVARELGRHPAQVALNWVVNRSGVTAALVGATTQEQSDENLGSLEFVIPPELVARLERASHPEDIYPYQTFADPELRTQLAGGAKIIP
jgi:aryl-alcohol dehydrogenase-like predicted oxidoreductase